MPAGGLWTRRQPPPLLPTSGTGAFAAVAELISRTDRYSPSCTGQLPDRVPQEALEDGPKPAKFDEVTVVSADDGV